MKDGKKLILDITRDGGRVDIKIVHQDASLYGAGFLGRTEGPPPLEMHSTKDLPTAATHRHIWLKGNASQAGEIVTWFNSGIAAEAWVDRLEELVEQINGETDHIPDAGNMVGTSPNWEIGEQREIRGQWYECREEATYPSCEDQHGNTCAKAAFCLSGDPTEFPEFSEGDSCDGIVLIAIDPPTGDSPFPDRLRKFAEARRDDYEAMDAEESDTIMALTPEETFRTALATVRYAAGRLARVADELAYSSDDYIADEVASVSRLIVDFQRAAKFFGHAETRKTVAKLHTFTPDGTEAEAVHTEQEQPS